MRVENLSEPIKKKLIANQLLEGESICKLQDICQPNTQEGEKCLVLNNLRSVIILTYVK